MGWKVIIGEAATETTFDANLRFDLQTRVQDDENGVVNFIETFIEVEGDVVKSSSASVSSALVAIEALAQRNHCESQTATRWNQQVRLYDLPVHRITQDNVLQDHPGRRGR
jgi:uncharacterized protein YggL (DUF469 family)